MLYTHNKCSFSKPTKRAKRLRLGAGAGAGVAFLSYSNVEVMEVLANTGLPTYLCVCVCMWFAATSG